MSNADEKEDDSVVSGSFGDANTNVPVKCPFKDFPDNLPWSMSIYQTGLLPLSSRFAAMCQYMDASQPLAPSTCAEMNVYLCQEYSAFEESCALHLADEWLPEDSEEPIPLLVLVCLSAQISEGRAKKCIVRGYQGIGVYCFEHALFVALSKAHDRYQYLTSQKCNSIETRINDLMWTWFPSFVHLALPLMEEDIDPLKAPFPSGHSLHRQQGSGSFATVYSLSPDNDPEPLVAKIIEKSRAATFARVQNICGEIKVLRLLQKRPHKNIISLIQVYHSPKHISIVMSNGGRNLYGVLRSGGKPPKALQSFCEQLIEAISHLHQHYVAHRDLKPENILIDYRTEESLRLRLCDFGCSQVFKDKASRISSWIGTFPFYAPEMLHPPYAPFPVDVWAVGLVCLEIIKGINCMTRKAGLPSKPQNLQDAKQLTARIACFLGTFPDFCDVSDAVPINVPGMLTLAVHQRMTLEK